MNALDLDIARSLSERRGPEAEAAARLIAGALPDLIDKAERAGLDGIAIGLRFTFDETLRAIAEINLRRGRVRATAHWLAQHQDYFL